MCLRLRPPLICWGHLQDLSPHHRVDQAYRATEIEQTITTISELKEIKKSKSKDLLGLNQKLIEITNTNDKMKTELNDMTKQLETEATNKTELDK